MNDYLDLFDKMRTMRVTKMRRLPDKLESQIVVVSRQMNVKVNWWSLTSGYSCNWLLYYRVNFVKRALVSAGVRVNEVMRKIIVK